MGGRYEIALRGFGVRPASVSVRVAHESPSGANLDGKGEQLLVCRLSG